jgi:hypothetical protein
LLAEAGFEKERLSSGGRIAPGLTRQQRTRGSSSKRKNNVVDGSCNSTELHLNTADLMEMGYEYVDGEPPAAAAKLRSGTQNMLLLFTCLACTFFCSSEILVVLLHFIRPDN